MDQSDLDFLKTLEPEGLSTEVGKVSDFDQSDMEFLYGSAARKYGIEPEKPAPPLATRELPEDDPHREFAIKHPNTYAAGRVFWDSLVAMRQATFPTVEELTWMGDELLKIVPFARHIATPERIEEFLELNPAQKTKALAWDAVETALLAAPVATLKFPFQVAKKAISPAWKMVKPGFKFKPIEDIALREIRPYFTEEAAYNLLRKKGFKKGEIGAILNDDILRYYQGQMGKGTPISKALREATEWVGEGRLPQLTGKFREMLNPERLRAYHYQKEWRRVIGKHLERGYDKSLPGKIFDRQVEATLGKEYVGEVTLKNATDVQMANFTRHILDSPKVIEKAAREGFYQKWLPDILGPVRVVLGAWEKPYKAYTRIYKVIAPAAERKNTYVVEKMLQMGKMYEERGLGKIAFTKKNRLKFTPAFGEGDVKAVETAMQEIDNLTSLRKKIPVAVKDLEKQIGDVVGRLSETQRKIYKTHKDFYDHLYAEHVLIKIPQLFERAGLTAEGRRATELMESRIAPLLGKLFSKSGSYPHELKVRALEGILEKVRSTLPHPARRVGKHPWFNSTGEKLERTLMGLEKDLTIGGEQGRFIGYLENYSARIGQEGGARISRWGRDLVGEMHSFYTKGRKEILGANLLREPGAIMDARIRAQANELLLYPAIEKAVASAMKMPSFIKEYVEHWIARHLGLSSYGDEKLSKFFQRTVGKLGGRKIWTEDRVTHLARRLNDLAILGGLGFKPFAYMRNMFQPLLTVPADLGGVKGFYHLLRGYKRAFDPAFRSWVREIGAIQEFAPELYFSQRLHPFGTQVKWDKMRDVALWMYSHSDRMNRYVTAGAATHKWDAALAKVGQSRIMDTEEGFRLFSKKAGLSGRFPWARSEIEGMVRAGRFKEARAAFAKDVCADCQYLYRPTEAALISQKYGSLGRTGFLFQSWWTNYLTLFEKWARTGDSGAAKANRMFTWMLSSAMGASVMETMWGPGTAMRSTFLGPVPLTLDKMLLPPTWTPVYEFLHGIGYALPQALWKGEPEKLATNAKSLFRSLAIMVPGGLQIKQMAMAAKREGWGGIPPSIIRYQKVKGRTPLLLRPFKQGGRYPSVE